MYRIIFIDNFSHLCYIYIDQIDRITHQVDVTKLQKEVHHET